LNLKLHPTLAEIFVLTARQYGEVELPDDASGQSRVLGISHEPVPVQGGYGAFFPSHGTNFLASTGVAVQF